MTDAAAQIANVKITRTQLGPESHGIFTCLLYWQSGQGITGVCGGYDLRGQWAWQYIQHTLDVVSVERWEDLVGKYMRVDRAGLGPPRRIGHIIEDRWFDMAAFMKEAVK